MIEAAIWLFVLLPFLLPPLIYGCVIAGRYAWLRAEQWFFFKND